MVLNIIWIVLITKKVYLFLKTGDVEEIYKIKKSSEKVKAKWIVLLYSDITIFNFDLDKDYKFNIWIYNFF